MLGQHITVIPEPSNGDPHSRAESFRRSKLDSNIFKQQKNVFSSMGGIALVSSLTSNTVLTSKTFLNALT